MQWKPKLLLSLEVCFNQITSNKSMSILYILNEKINNKARHNLINAKYRWRSDQLDRWHWKFFGTTWSNESDANPPEGDTNPPEGDNP